MLPQVVQALVDAIGHLMSLTCLPTIRCESSLSLWDLMLLTIRMQGVWKRMPNPCNAKCAYRCSIFLWELWKVMHSSSKYGLKLVQHSYWALRQQEKQVVLAVSSDATVPFSVIAAMFML